MAYGFATDRLTEQHFRRRTATYGLDVQLLVLRNLTVINLIMKTTDLLRIKCVVHVQVQMLTDFWCIF